MIKIIKVLLIFLIILIPVTWLSDHPGEVRILWKDYFIETSMLIIILILIFISIVFTLLIFSYKKFINFPKEYKKNRSLKYLKLGNRSLIDLTSSIESRDFKRIDSDARKIKKYLGNSAFSTYILSQSAVATNDFNAARKYLELLMTNPEMRFVGLKGMITISLKEKNNNDALRYLKEAKLIKPRNLWVLDQLSLLLAKSKKWEEAAKVLENISSEENKTVSINRASFLLKSGANPVDSWKASKNFIPAALEIMKHYLENNQERQAYEVIKVSWKSLKYIGMIELFMQKKITNLKVSLRRLKLLHKALKENINDDETKLALAYASYFASLWGESASYLEKIKKENWDQRASDLCEKLKHESDRIKLPEIPEKLARVPKWSCASCGQEHNKWEIQCNACGDIGRIKWSKSNITRESQKKIESFF
jgi:HemY protein